MGKVIDIEFGEAARRRWCCDCDEPFPEATAVCPRCGGELISVAQRRAEVVAHAQRRLRHLGLSLGLLILALVVLAFLL